MILMSRYFVSHYLFVFLSAFCPNVLNFQDPVPTLHKPDLNPKTRFSGSFALEQSFLFSSLIIVDLDSVTKMMIYGGGNKQRATDKVK